MDVRCEKCQTEYELDEARLKPGGVTVKCTHCGHMFKIRKRSPTNVGSPAVVAQTVTSAPPPSPEARTRPMSKGGLPRDEGDAAGAERQWLIRLENGEQKSCRELATLQQWIIAGVVTRDSLISRSGKTWKMLGDIPELQQYFVIADEARATREQKPTKPPAAKPAAGTMLGVNAGPRAAVGGGHVVDDTEEAPRAPAKRPITQPPPPPLPASAKTPPLGSPTRPPPTPARGAPAVDPMAQTTQARKPTPAPPAPAPAPEPAPAPAAKPERPATWAAMPEKPAVPAGRSTAVWATDNQGVDKQTAGPDDTTATGPSAGAFSGRIAAIPDEPAFTTGKAGKVRVEPSDESAFQTGKVRLGDTDDDDLLMPARQGSRAGLWIALLVLLLGGGGAAAYFLILKKPAKAEIADGSGSGSGSAGSAVAIAGDAGVAVSPIDDAPIAAAEDPFAAPRRELAGDVEARLRDQLKAIADSTPDPEALAMRAHVAAQLAQDLLDRAGLVADKAEAEALRKEAKALAIDVATMAQKAHKAKPDSASGNVAMADALRLQNKRAADIKRYSDPALADKAWKREAALADALVLARDGKLDDAKAALAAIEPDATDVRARFHLALIAYAQNKPADAKPLVDQVLATSPEHAAARALAARLETLVAKTDPLPPEEHGSGSAGSAGSAVVPPAGGGGGGGGGGSYDQLMADANKIADTNCTRALELYQKALDLKPDSVEAHTGMGYCFVDAKQFASAQSKFRTALRFSPRYEPALYGIAEAYQQQGRKDDAIDAFKAYLAVYPGAAKAIKALERLGVTDTGSAPAPTPPAPTPTPTPPAPTPTPTPAPAPSDGSAAQ